MGHTKDEDASWKQHFPTCEFKDRDIALQEYELATKTLEAEERLFLNAANLSAVVGAALGTLALGSIEKLTNEFSPVLSEMTTISAMLVITLAFGALALRYFADRHRTVVYAARKVIVLRRMLGMTYGTLQLVLPRNRIEGADDPFLIRVFPGWNTYASYPCHSIAGISSAVVFFLLAALMARLTERSLLNVFDPTILLVAAFAGSFALLAIVYRLALLDTHETPLSVFSEWIASKLRVRLVDDMEQVLYRATLARYEMRRLRIDLGGIKRVLVHIEDKEFFRHSGISWKGLARAALSAVGLYRRTGGSSITQQLARTLFIVDQRKLVRRKLVELLLAKWLDQVIEKENQLELYLASVRFEHGVIGLPSAMKHFFGSSRRQVITKGRAFFLIERVSNVRSRLLGNKIDQTLRSTVSAGLLDAADAREAVGLYGQSIQNGKIKVSSSDDYDRLSSNWKKDTGQSALSLRAEESRVSQNSRGL